MTGIVRIARLFTRAVCGLIIFKTDTAPFAPKHTFRIQMGLHRYNSASGMFAMVAGRIECQFVNHCCDISAGPVTSQQ